LLLCNSITFYIPILTSKHIDYSQNVYTLLKEDLSGMTEDTSYAYIQIVHHIWLCSVKCLAMK